ncbi:circularly permuted type 2 ATP-grasp protein [Paenibacillus athensensis]|uniref:Circularly permuted ATP-grasp type 2 domain-containing protein n=1 Tax=Paenibacillus athensensis TaxID=1967502 RepID=A0A4Y8Q921_9BACL|nr:circularly permuted type 2 ATP-grasp protein [Paenibacillus athensensis]MCD1258906.1 circularly permuted type 2 ATP-grasp protein [Paenibacillus athensensis]
MSKVNRAAHAPYALGSFYDEMFGGEQAVRPHYSQAHRLFAGMSPAELAVKQAAMEQRMLEEGITFTIYKPEQVQPLERTIPFDLIPRIIARDEWAALEAGLQQRVKALNRFVHDVYHEQRIVQDGIVPRRMIVANRYFRPEMMRVDVPGQAYVTTSGIDLIRDAAGEYYVLEDNLRSPSGFSYLFKSRSLMNGVFPELTFSCSLRDVELSLNHFLTTLRSLSPNAKSEPVIALLTPGEYNSAYYEHAFLAQQMGIHLVEGRDLTVIDHKLYIRSLKGLLQVDVLYRRIDDDYLDPLAFRPDSCLGVAGIMNAYRAGNVAIVNAPGTGVADDKAIYVYVPDMIRYYLNEEPLLKNVPTYMTGRKEEREYVLEHIHEMVVKETSLSGGYGMLIGPAATEAEIAAFREQIVKEPERYIAQPTVQLSRAPIIQNGQMTPRHIDLRAFVLMGADESMHVVPGGLTRVAMKMGSLVVNSSQGGGCKDTWVLA